MQLTARALLLISTSADIRTGRRGTPGIRTSDFLLLLYSMDMTVAARYSLFEYIRSSRMSMSMPSGLWASLGLTCEGHIHQLEDQLIAR